MTKSKIEITDNTSFSVNLSTGMAFDAVDTNVGVNLDIDYLIQCADLIWVKLLSEQLANNTTKIFIVIKLDVSNPNWTKWVGRSNSVIGIK